MKVGDYVELLDDTISGEVVAIEENRVTIETEDGFSMQFAENELVVVRELNIRNSELKKAILQKTNGVRKKRKKSKKRAKQKPMEVDLHIEHYVKSTKGMDNFDMLNLQLRTAQSQLEFAIKKRIQRVVFIHGVGEGVLRSELETLFRRYDEVEFYDADFSQYGRGATEVYIYQNN